MQATGWLLRAVGRLLAWLAWALVGWLSGEMPGKQPTEQAIKVPAKQRCAECGKRPGGRLTKRAMDMMPGSQAAKQAIGQTLCPDCLLGLLVISGWAYNQADDLTPYWRPSDQEAEQPTE